MNELYHHGIKGQRWGVRRFQNPDGTLTDAGKKRYQKELNRASNKKEKYEKSARRIMDYDSDIIKRIQHESTQHSNEYEIYGYESEREFIEAANKAINVLKTECDITKKYLKDLDELTPTTVSEVKALGKKYSKTISEQVLFELLPPWIDDFL